MVAFYGRFWALVMPVVLIVTILHAAENPPPTYADVPYDVHKRTKLDFWQADGEGPRPVRVFIHGGGWIQGDKDRKVGQIEESLEKGISVAAINYRYSVTDPLPAPVHDAVRAIQFLRYKAGEWNIDKNRFVLTGSSAGGLAINRALSGNPAKIVALEMGGNNPLVVHRIEDVEGHAVVTGQDHEIRPAAFPCSFHIIQVRGGFLDGVG